MRAIYLAVLEGKIENLVNLLRFVSNTHQNNVHSHEITNPTKFLPVLVVVPFVMNRFLRPFVVLLEAYRRSLRFEIETVL
jgi:hypothetical protein